DWKGNRSTIIALAAGLAGAGVVYLINKSDLHLSGLAPVGLVAGLLLIVRAGRNWEFGVKSILVIVVLEGAVRKWLLPSFSEVVYFYKDILIAVTLLAYLSKRSKVPLTIKRYLSPLSLALMAFTIYSLIVALNPTGSHILISLLGLKAYCLYIPLTFMTAR